MKNVDIGTKTSIRSGF